MQRPLGFYSMLGFLPVMAATFSDSVGCKNLLFDPKKKDECLAAPYMYLLSRTRELENAAFFLLVERRIFTSLF